MYRALAGLSLGCLALFLAQSVGAHGTERHFGASLNDRPAAFKSSPAFLELAIGVSFSRAKSHVKADLAKLDADLTQLIRYTNQLAESHSDLPDFGALFLRTVDQAESVRTASQQGRHDQAVEQLASLQQQFERLRPMIRKKARDEE